MTDEQPKFKQFGPAVNKDEFGDGPWIGHYLLVVPFDPRMEQELEELAKFLEARNYYGFTGTRDDLYEELLTKGHRD